MGTDHFRKDATTFPGADRGPALLYGTAWKEAETERLTWMALEAGFRGIDTANQRRHYHEAGVGAALARAFASGLLERKALFLQTKFTSVDGQDHRLPYDANADAATQVEQSLLSSLDHLGVDWIDSYVLHGPTTRIGLAPYDLAVWRAMESLARSGRVRHLGASNVTLEQLERLCSEAEVQPAFVQNRCYARMGWDRAVRAMCDRRGIVYQAFSLLTANRAELARPEIRALAAAHRKTIAQVIFRFAEQVGMQPLTGTSNPVHMREDLEAGSFDLAPDELRVVETISG